MQKEAQARIKINKMLENSWWRFLDEWDKKANIDVETNIKISEVWEDFEHIKDGFIDYLLLDDKWFPICVLEAKSEDKDPLVWKEQARVYANTENVRFIILSNGNIHYFWDKEKWNPTRVSHVPTLEALEDLDGFKPNQSKIIDEKIESDYIALTQNPRYAEDPRRNDESKRWDYLAEKWYRLFRKYQLDAIKSIQNAIKKWENRFLWEMATGTGKTLSAAWLIKLFLRTWQAKRVLFLVDRLELEVQAKKAFVTYLWNDYQTVVFKENRDDRRKAEIVVTTIQSLSYNNKYLNLFSPSDFDLVISDEAHRSISWSNRAIFEYFLWYKLGLTATPKDYLKNIDQKVMSEEDPRQIEQRQLRSTYATFGCESGEPTFRYSLTDWVQDPEWPYLTNPISLDCRTDITTQLLSDDGYAIKTTWDDGSEQETIYKWSSFERKFFSDKTNIEFCKTFLENADKDPISGEIWKSIFFCVSRKHASKITELLNKLAHEMFPWKYNSDFAVQITSDIPSAQQFTINFANDNLNGHSKFLEWYNSSKTRICVTVWMMTTGYDCQNLLNICLARPIFSPSDFVQIKWRWTRTYIFKYNYKLKNNWISDEINKKIKKENFKLFDFFANCEYFETKYPYDEVLKLPELSEPNNDQPEFTEKKKKWEFESEIEDPMQIINTIHIDENGMRIDRELYTSWFEKTIKEHFEEDKNFKQAVENRDYEEMESYVKANIFDKPNEYYNIVKLREWYKPQTDRRLWLWEMLDFIFGKINKFKTKDEIANEEFEKFMVENSLIDQDKFYAAKWFFKYYLVDEEFRANVNLKNFHLYSSQPEMLNIFKTLGWEHITLLTDYIKDNVNQKQFY